MADEDDDRAWVVREVEDLGLSGRGRLRRVTVDLPDGSAFDQFVLELPAAVVVAAINDAGELLMIRRFRFVVDQWVWELPGGYVDDEEDTMAAAQRELEEETGWTSDDIQQLVSFEPMVGSASALNTVCVARRCVELVGQQVDINEATEVRWISLAHAEYLISAGEIVGSASVVAIAWLRRSLD